MKIKEKRRNLRIAQLTGDGSKTDKSRSRARDSGTRDTRAGYGKQEVLNPLSYPPPTLLKKDGSNSDTKNKSKWL